MVTIQHADQVSLTITVDTSNLGAMMATVQAQLADIQAKADAGNTATNAVLSAFTSLAEDVQAALDAAADPNVDEQAALDNLRTSLENNAAQVATHLDAINALQTRVGDANGDGAPAPVKPLSPITGDPTADGDQLPPGESHAEQPAEGDPVNLGTGTPVEHVDGGGPVVETTTTDR